MQLGSSKLTAIYFFSSLRADSGKSSIVSNLSIYLDSIGYKVAVIDLDYNNPKKLRTTYPLSCEIQEYSELSELVKSDAPRFQQNFYLTNPNRLSFFNAQELKNPYELMSDIAFRDFLVLLNNSFDYVLVNLMAGVNQSVIVSDLLSKSYLWRGYKPASIIISLTDERSLIELDSFIQNNQIVNYQAEENTYFLFNKVPDVDRELDKICLNSVEIRNVFTYPLVYVFPYIDEYIEQKNNVNPFVLQSESEINKNIVALTKVLNGLGSISFLRYETNIYQSCISGSLLNQIYPFIEKLQQKIAKKLFIDTSDVNVYVEQNEENFRIRVRLTSCGQKLLGIRSDIPDYEELVISDGKRSDSFPFGTLKDKFKAFDQLTRETPYSLTFKSIFSFNDNFYYDPVKVIRKTLPILFSKNSFLSPSLFEFSSNISEIPTLSNIIGLVKKQNFIKYYDVIEKISLQEVNPVYIPIDFPLLIKLATKNADGSQPYIRYADSPLRMDISVVRENKYNYSYKRKNAFKLFDIFESSFNYAFTSDFSIKFTKYQISFKGYYAPPTGKLPIIDDNIIENNNSFIVVHPNLPDISDKSVSKFKVDCVSELKFDFGPIWYGNLLMGTIKSPNHYQLNQITHNKNALVIRKYDFNITFSIPKLVVKVTNYNLFTTKFKQIDFEGIKESCHIKNFYINKLQVHNDYNLEMVDRNFKSLQKSFAFNDLLMEYSYLIGISNKIKTNYNSELKITKKVELNFQIRYKFSNKYMEPDLTMRTTYQKPAMYQLFNLGNLRVSKKVLVSSVDYKVAYNDIFVCTKIEIDNELFFEREFELPKTLELKDISFNDRNLFILRIKEFFINSKNTSPYIIDLPPICERLEESFGLVYESFRISLRVFSFAKIAFIKNEIKSLIIKFKKFETKSNFIADKDFELKDDSILNFDATFDSEIEPPLIFTENIRVRSEKFYSYKFINPELSIVSPKRVLPISFDAIIPTLIHHKISSYLDGLKKEKDLQLRVRTRALKLIDNFTILSDYNPKNYEFTYTLKDRRLPYYQEELKRINVSSQKEEYLPKYPVFKPISKYVLKKFALKKPKLGSIKRAILVITEESWLDFLFDYFIWFSKNCFGPIKYDYNKSLSDRFINRFNSNFKGIFDLEPIYSNKLDFCNRKNYLMSINKTFIREHYKIIKKDMVKDLLAYAKMQFNKVSSSFVETNNAGRK